MGTEPMTKPDVAEAVALAKRLNDERKPMPQHCFGVYRRTQRSRTLYWVSTIPKARSTLGSGWRSFLVWSPLKGWEEMPEEGDGYDAAFQ